MEMPEIDRVNEENQEDNELAETSMGTEIVQINNTPIDCLPFDNDLLGPNLSAATQSINYNARWGTRGIRISPEALASINKGVESGAIPRLEDVIKKPLFLKELLEEKVLNLNTRSKTVGKRDYC